MAGIEGGESAARRLRGSLKQELKSLNKFVDHWKILIRVYANITGLGRNYVESGVIANEILWRNFVDGFNRSSQWHEFVDAGRDKEAADDCIRGKCMIYGGQTDRHVQITETSRARRAVVHSFVKTLGRAGSIAVNHLSRQRRKENANTKGKRRERERQVNNVYISIHDS